MKPRITLITLGVDDLETAVAFFELQSSLKLALWSRDDVAHDTRLTKTPRSATEMSLGHNVGSQAEVDMVMAQAKRAGARMVKPAATTFWGGYAGYFQDPDEHLWEIAWNPQFAMVE